MRISAVFSSDICPFNFHRLVKKYISENVLKMKKFGLLPAAIYALSYEEIQSFGSLDQGRESRVTLARLIFIQTVNGGRYVNPLRNFFKSQLLSS